MESKLSECVHKIRMISNTQHIVILVPFTLKNLLKSFYTLYEQDALQNNLVEASHFKEDEIEAKRMKMSCLIPIISTGIFLCVNGK